MGMREKQNFQTGEVENALFCTQGGRWEFIYFRIFLSGIPELDTPSITQNKKN